LFMLNISGKRKRKASFVLAALLFLSSCSLIPTEHSKSQGVKSAEAISTSQSLVVERINRDLTVSSNAVPFRIESKSEQSADARGQATGTSIVSIPMGVKIGLLAAGLCALVFAIGMVRRSSAAANAAFQVADQKLANVIGNLRNKATTSTDHATIAEAQSIIAELEKNRGQLAASRK
jgi:hypothetical protein